MKHLFFLFSFIICITQLKSQCFQIQSILVDACAGSQEGQNEMVTFQVGSTALNTANLSVNWPNNSWLGLTKNAGTASDIATVNATIQGCGFLKEPVSGVLPANAKVLLVSSTAWTPLAQSFVNLTDTLYVIFQTAGNTAGHFANYQAGGGLRTLTMTFSVPASCTDAVTYDRALLTNQAGNVGAQDGGAVEFSAAGTPTYVNHGCQAPFIPLSVDAGVNKTICVGATQNFSATTSGIYTSVNWSLGAGASGIFSPTNSLNTTYTPGASETGTVKLYCTIIKSCGTQTTSVKDSVNLTITPLPTVTVSPNSVSICSGQSAIVQASASTAVTYSWSTGATTSSVSLNTAGIYTVNVSNSCGNSSATVSVSISSAPTLSLASSSSSLCSSGQTATLSLSGSTGTYSWSNGTNSSSAVVSTPGVYTATVTTAGCGSASTSITISTIPLPTVSISIPSTSVCAGSALTFTANSSNANYLWTGGATTQTINVSSTPVVVTTTNVCGSAQATQTLDIVPLPTVTVSPNIVTLCSGQSATVQANSNTPVSYAWSNGPSTNTVSLNSAGVYTVTVSNSCGNASETVSVSISSAPSLYIVPSVNTICASGQTATLSLTGSVGTYTWSTGVNTATTLISSPGVYSATVSTSGCGNAVANISLGTAPLPVVSISAPLTNTICSGGSVILTATSNEGNYLWSNGATTNTVIVNTASITVTSTNACGSSQATQTLNIIPLPTVTVTPSSTVICSGGTATLAANTSNANNYLWSTGDITPTVLINTPGVVTVIVTNVCGSATSSANISSVSFPPLTLTPSSNTICPNETATLTVTGGAAPYVWSNSSNTGSVVTTTGGVITVSNTNACGTNTASVLISVVSINADVIANPTSGVLPVVVSFTNNSSNANSYAWNFGNGNSAITSTVSSQTYNTAGTYTVYLTASNGTCSDVDYVIITVLNEEPTLYVPNAFTPNGDSINDIFLVGATNIKEFNIMIFDRWGLKMFESSDILKGWDGKVNGKEVADGTYFHLINAKDIDGKEIKKQGTITLFK
jgi:gliding motility-associated-like protein